MSKLKGYNSCCDTYIHDDIRQQYITFLHTSMIPFILSAESKKKTNPPPQRKFLFQNSIFLHPSPSNIPINNLLCLSLLSLNLFITLKEQISNCHTVTSPVAYNNSHWECIVDILPPGYNQILPHCHQPSHIHQR